MPLDASHRVGGYGMWTELFQGGRKDIFNFFLFTLQVSELVLSPSRLGKDSLLVLRSPAWFPHAVRALLTLPPSVDMRVPWGQGLGLFKNHNILKTVYKARFILGTQKMFTELMKRPSQQIIVFHLLSWVEKHRLCIHSLIH